MSIITTENYETAYFSDNERTFIEVLLKTETEGEYEPLTLEIDEDSEELKDLLNIVTLDDIEKNTLDKIKDERAGIEAFHIWLIESGKAILPNNGTLDDNAISELIRETVGLKESSEEDLFKIKLLAFELEQIVDAPTEIKEDIRNATSQFEVLSILKTYADSL